MALRNKGNSEMVDMAAKKERAEELSVLKSELSNLRPEARVYEQRTRTPIFFRTTQAKALEKTRRELEATK
ncbi:hypothetical protein LPJ64_002563 [Coemansia asiatica]|uniref:Uncharacterized protein n=1 Tax=Coemansia asiatica TaxID=1052880 RepID=A0A9W8CKV1_9FUNG|nr:hypothetical protein LPJ64_002563 [Coemansia asiatica]